LKKRRRLRLPSFNVNANRSLGIVKCLNFSTSSWKRRQSTVGVSGRPGLLRRPNTQLFDPQKSSWAIREYRSDRPPCRRAMQRTMQNHCAVFRSAQVVGEGVRRMAEVRRALDDLALTDRSHRALAASHPAIAVAPGERVLEPVHVIARRIILAGVGAAALGSVKGGVQHRCRLTEEIVGLSSSSASNRSVFQIVAPRSTLKRGAARPARRAGLLKAC
jgi:Fumarate reductase flavoprotein C-term